MTFGCTGSKQTQPLYLKSYFNFGTLNPFEHASYGKMVLLQYYP